MAGGGKQQPYEREKRLRLEIDDDGVDIRIVVAFWLALLSISASEFGYSESSSERTLRWSDRPSVPVLAVGILPVVDDAALATDPERLGGPAMWCWFSALRKNEVAAGFSMKAN